MRGAKWMLRLIFIPPGHETFPGGSQVWEEHGQASSTALHPCGRLRADALAVPLPQFALFILKTNDIKQFQPRPNDDSSCQTPYGV